MPNFRQPDKTVSKAFVQNGVYVGRVTRVDEVDQRVYVEIPRYVTGFEFGPLNVACSDLPRVNDSVACLFLENRQDDVMVIGIIKDDVTDITVTPVVADSANRPAFPRVGTILYETDTEDVYVWTGTEWLTFFEVNLPATIYADLQGTAASATIAASAVYATNAGTALTVADNSVVLGNDTTGDYVATITAGTGVSISAGAGTGEGSTPTLAIGQSVATSASPSFSTITSTVATGTAPLTVTSTTAVTNLNADYLDGEHGSYYRNVDNANAGVLAIARGGTNNGSLAVTDGGIVYADGTRLQTTAAGTSGQVLTSAGTGDPVWSSGPSTLPWGYLSQDSSTTSATATSTTYVNTDLDLTVTTSSGRRLKWTVTGHCYSDTANGVVRLALRNTSGTVLAVTDVLCSAANLATGFTIVYFEVAGATSVQRRVSVMRPTGTGNRIFFADSDRVAYLTCEDVGD